jgi:putative flippase GtrA
MLKFVLVAAAGIGINGLVVDASLRIDGVHYLSAQVIATAVVLVLGYLANRHWTFKEP